jgi:hypothetical protein
MTVVSSCDGVMGAEERLNAKSGYGYLKIVCSEMKLDGSRSAFHSKYKKKWPPVNQRALVSADNDRLLAPDNKGLIFLLGQHLAANAF